MSTEIAIRTDKTFVEPELNQAVKGLSRAFQNINKNRRDACLILWRLEDGKKYEKDGFKSLQEFAETIGIDKSSAHKMADAGRVYDSKIPEIAQFADKAGYTVAANVASMLKDDSSAKVLEDAIKNKEITDEMTVDEVKTWKSDTIAQSKPEKVVPTWHIVGNAAKIIRNDKEVNTEYIDIDVTVGIEKPIEWAREFDSTALAATMKDPDGIIHYFGLTADGSMFAYTATKVQKQVKKEKTKKKSLDDMTPEEFKEWAEARGMKITFTTVNEK